MCGINGFIQFERRFPKEELADTVSRMNSAIIHRGPDDDGLYCDDYCAIGMRRLAIIDLNSGDQPIWNERKDKLIVFNGELYNYQEIKKNLLSKGHRFYTSSDTEVVLHAYEEYGLAELLNKMEGMFAFCIYEIAEKRWILARDRIGEKPLYYTFGDRWMQFASELKSIIVAGFVKKEIDQEAVSQFFQLTYIPAPKSVFKSVSKLLPGSYMVINASGAYSTDTYWEPNFNLNTPSSYKITRKSFARH